MVGEDGYLSGRSKISRKLVESAESAEAGGQRHAETLVQDPSGLLGIQGQGLYLANLHANLNAQLTLLIDYPAARPLPIGSAA